MALRVPYERVKCYSHDCKVYSDSYIQRGLDTCWACPEHAQPWRDIPTPPYEIRIRMTCDGGMLWSRNVRRLPVNLVDFSLYFKDTPW